MSKERIEELCEYIDKNRAKKYPIFNQKLCHETDYIKNAYFKMLAVILQQGSEISAAQCNLFGRQVEGCSCDYSMTDYLRQALEIEIEEYVDFTEQCKKMPVCYRFMLDALLLTATEKKDDEQLNLVASFAEALEIEKDELKYLALLAKAILEQDMSAYVAVEMNKKNTISGSIGIEYIREPVYQNESMTIIHSYSPDDINIGMLEETLKRKTPVIQMSNINISLADYSLTFYGYKKVILDNCVFEGGAKYPVRFENCSQVVITSCIFRGFTTFALVEEYVGEAVIEDTRFENCMREYDDVFEPWTETGCVIHAESHLRNGENRLLRCTFTGCGGKNTEGLYSSAFISNCRSRLNGCFFENCWHYYRDGMVDLEGSKRSMFTADSLAFNCWTINSASIT